MINRFLDYIKKNDLFTVDSKILIAVSGGIDSMVMAHLFVKCGFKIGIAHCNFALRGNESDGDEQLVQQFAAQHDIPFFSIRFHTKQYADNNKVSIEVAARELRYAWFEEIRIKDKYDYIAVAHNMNDNIETVLFNLTRGTGLTGLSGIRNKNNYIVRPLLFATREDIVNFSTVENITYHNDHTNAETKFSRNKIRHLVVPVLKEINPSVERDVNECASRLYEIDSFLNEQVSLIKKNIFEAKDEVIYADIKNLSTYTTNKSVIYEIFKDFGIAGSRVNNLLSIINNTSGKWISTPSHRILRDREKLIITKHGQHTRINLVINNLDELNATGFISGQVMDKKSDFVIPQKKEIGCLDYEKLSFPMILRTWKDGDNFVPFGMKGKKKVSDYLIDNKISLNDKENTMVLTSNDQIIWLVAERIDNRFKITEYTKTILVISCTKLSE